MKLLYPLLWSRPDRKACRAQTMGTAAALARRGVAVTLLMPQGSGDPALGADDLRAYFEVEGEFGLVQRPSRWAGESATSQLLWLRQVFRDPALADADLIYSRIPAMLAVGGRAPLPFATDHYRPWPDDLPAIRPLLRRTARSRKCLGLILHSAYAARAYERAGIDPSMLLVAHNGADPAPSAAGAVDLPRDRPIALYAGRINAAKGLDEILLLADLRPDILFVLVGSEGQGPVEAAAAGRTNVRVVPWQPPGALAAWLAAADVLLIPPSRAPLEQFRNCVLPVKLFAYLAAGKPILAPIAPDTAELLRDGENALLVPPGRPDLASIAVDRVLKEPGLADCLAVAAERSAETLTWDHRAAKIAAFLEPRLSAPNKAAR